MTFHFDPRDPDFRRDPYPYYDQLRAHAPVFRWAAWDATFCTRYAECNALLRDNRLGHGNPGNPPPGEEALYTMQSNWLLFQDPPGHTRLRGLVHKAFSPRMVEQLRSTIQQITDNLLDRALPKGEWDLIADLAYPLPVTVIAEMLAIPPAAQERFHAWSDALGRSLDLTEDPEVYLRASQAAAELTEFLRGLAEERRRNPGSDLVSALVAVEETGDTLTADELYATCALLLFAGHETTINLIGNGTLALLRHPEQTALLRARPELARSAVEELLRYDSPVQMTSRMVLEEVEVAGQRLEPGRQVSFMLGAANRDPAVFAHPGRLDITRKPNPHLAFGSGIHYCLGAPLARLEGEIAFNTLLRRAGSITLLEDAPPHRDNYLLRGLERLPVATS